MTLAIRSGLSFASGYAIKTLSKFWEKLPEKEKSSLEATRSRLQSKIMIITPSIDLIELISARGNTSLQSTVELTQHLKRDIDEFEKKVDAINDDITRLGTEGGTEARTKGTAQAAVDVEACMKDLLFRIEDAIPLISLALTTSGANLSARLPDSVSPSRLLQASNHVTNADNAFVSAGRKRMIQVGPTFTLTLYTIFYGTSRNPHATEHGDVTWKEEHPKCQVSIHRVPSADKNLNYKYQLIIDEDLDDGRYHDDDEKAEGGRSRTIDVSLVTRLFFTASGTLLQIKEAKTPVLVLKLNTVFENTGDEYNDTNGHIEWLAFELYDNKGEEEEYEPDDDEEEPEEEEQEEAEKGADRTPPEEGEPADTPAPDLLADRMANLSINSEASMPSLSLLEYILRLTALQANDQASMYEIQDERISLYLRDEGATNSGSDTNATPSPQQLNHGSPGSLHVTQAYNRRPNRSSPSPRTPKTSKLGSNKASPAAVPLTPWEQDRLHNNPALRRALDMDYVESPLKGRSTKK